LRLATLLSFDLLYVQNWSLGLDFAILLRMDVVVGMGTFPLLVPARFRRGSRASG
jgi:lipopolysaccharide/colanic/teichoic acid biosynthesis glycosyltransferase